jgi:MFS family permease
MAPKQARVLKFNIRFGNIKPSSHFPPPPAQLSDVIGRKYSTFAAAVISAVFAAAGLGCTNYWSWVVMRLLSGVGAAGTALGAYILSTEAIGDGWRGARVV